MILPIDLYGNSVLRKESEEITADYPDLKQLINNMFETMYNADGIGLAAPQVGLSIRLLVIDLAPLKEDNPELAQFKKVMINPIMLEVSEEELIGSEGCLSIPGSAKMYLVHNGSKFSIMMRTSNCMLRSLRTSKPA